MEGIVIAICISEIKGVAKKEIPKGIAIEDFGLLDDAHAGNWHRQISLLCYEKVEEFRSKGAEVAIGGFGENLLVKGIDFKTLPVGTILKCNTVVMEITQVGKECHSHCSIYHQVGDCIMPREGVFARVKKGGTIEKGDRIYVEKEI